jgi:hypothetical protein
MRICLSRSKKMPPKRHTTNQSNAGKNSGGPAHSHKKSGDKSGFLNIPCRNENVNERKKCNTFGCVFLHTLTPNIPINKGNDLRAAACGGGSVAGLPKFDNQQLVPDPQKALFGEFKVCQMNLFHALVAKGMPEFFKALLQSNEGAFEAFGRSFASANAFDEFLEILKAFGVSINALKEFIQSNPWGIFNSLEENVASASEDEVASASEDEVASAPESAPDYEKFWTDFKKLIFEFLRKSVLETDILIYVVEIKPIGTYKTTIDQLASFYEALKIFIQSVEQSWDEINRPVLKVEERHVSAVEKSVQAVHDISGLRAMLEHELNKLNGSADEDNKKMQDVIQVWLDTIRRLSAIGIPVAVIFPKELLTEIGNSIPAVKAHIEETIAFKEKLKLDADIEHLRTLNLSSLCGGNVQRVDSSSVVSACCLAFSLLKGKYETIFAGWTKTLAKEFHDSICERFGDFFTLLQTEFLRMLSKGKHSSFFELLQTEGKISKKEEEERTKSLVEILEKVHFQFVENVSSSQDKILRNLRDISKNACDFKPLFQLMSVELPINGKMPIINIKVVDYLIKNLKMVFGDHLKIVIAPTGVRFGLTYGLEKSRDPIDVTEIVSNFLVKMLLLNRDLVSANSSPFFGNLKFDEKKKMVQDNNTIASSLLLTLGHITGSTSSPFANVLNSQINRCSGVVIPDNCEFPTRFRFEHFLNTLFKNCVSEKYLREICDSAVKSFTNEAASLFSTLDSKGLKDLLISILTSGYKPSQSSSMMKMFQQGVRLFSDDNHRALQELSSFVATPSEKLDESAFPYREEVFDIIENIVVSQKDHKTVMADFYQSLWRVLRFILENLSSMDMTRVYSLYTMLEFFNANSAKHTFKMYFPYATHFFCALLVALQNFGLSLGDALKLFSTAIVNPDFNQNWDEKTDNTMSKWIRNANNVYPATFKTLHQNHKTTQRTTLQDNTPIQIKIVLDGLLSQTVTPASEDLKSDIKNVVFILFAQDAFDRRPSALSFLNTMFSFVSMSLSPQSVEFFKLYGVAIDATGIQIGGCGSDEDCYNAYLRAVLPDIRSMITRQMGDAVQSIKKADQQSQEASSALTRQDLVDRFKNVQNNVVLKMFKELVINMGLMTASSVKSMKTIGEILANFKAEQSFIKESFLGDLSRSLIRFAFSYRDADKLEYQDRQFRRKQKEKKEAAAAAAADADAAVADADAAVADADADVASPVAPQISSTNFLHMFAEDSLKELFESFPPKSVCAAGMFIQLLKAILSIRDPNARTARYVELSKTFPDFFNIAFLATFNILNFSESDIIPEFVEELENHHRENSLSKAQFCAWLEIELDDNVTHFLDLCFEESRSEIRSFLDSQPSLSHIQLPDSFPDSDADADGPESFRTGPNDPMYDIM